MKKLFSDAAWLVLSKAASAPIILLATILIARDAGPDVFGKFAIGLTCVIFLAFACDFGVGVLATRKVAGSERSAKQMLVDSAISRMPFLVLAAAVTLFLADFLPLSLYVAATFLLAAVGRFSADLTIAVLQGRGRFSEGAYYQLFHAVVFYGVAVLYFSDGRSDVGNLFLVYFTLSALGAMVLANRVFFFDRGQPLAVDLPASRGLVRESVPYGVFWFGSIIYLSTDTFMVAHFLGDEATGYYQGAVKLVMAMDLAASFLAKSLLPKMTSVLSSGDDVRGAVRYVSVVAVLFAAGLAVLSGFVFLFADLIVILVLGSEFQNTVPVLALLVWIIPIRALNHLLGTFLTAEGAQVQRAIIVSVTAVLNGALNYLWVPVYGLAGAAYATILTTIAVLLLYFVTSAYRYRSRQLSAL